MLLLTTHVHSLRAVKLTSARKIQCSGEASSYEFAAVLAYVRSVTDRETWQQSRLSRLRAAGARRQPPLTASKPSGPKRTRPRKVSPCRQFHMSGSPHSPRDGFPAAAVPETQNTRAGPTTKKIVLRSPPHMIPGFVLARVSNTRIGGGGP